MNSDQSSTSSSRRDFLKESCSALALLSLTAGSSVVVVGCDSEGSGPPSLSEGLTLNGNTLTVDLTQFSDLTEPNGSLWIADLDVILINYAEDGYRAFDAVCPHEEQDVRIYEPTGSENYQLRCPAHDWTFAPDGDPTGKAQAGLSQFPTTKTGDTLQVTIDR